MSTPRTRRILLSLGLVLTALGGRLAAQDAVAVACSEGWSTLGALGITEFTCDCTYHQDVQPSWRFRGEPEIRSVDPDGPAAGQLRAGDVIVAINGSLITTRAAGLRMANLRPNTAVVLTIRRGNRELQVSIVPNEECPTPPVPAAVPPPTSTPRPARPASAARAVPAPATPMPPTTPAAWFGFGISCQNCTLDFDDRIDGSRWAFSEYPTLFSVDPGSPADEAGLRRGDVLLKIDGFPLITAEGARRFGQVESGQTVTWTYRRGGSERTARVTAARPPRAPGADVLSRDQTDALARLELLQAERQQQLDEQALLLRQSVERMEQEARGSDHEVALARIRAELEQAHSARRSETEVELAELREVLGRVEQERRLDQTEPQHLRFAGSVGNTEVEVRGQSTVDVSFDNSTGELLIRTLDATIRVKAPVQR
jgi:PDZ domain